MQDISLHLLDIIENSAQAGAQIITISIDINKIANSLTLQVDDDGKGMDAETLQNAQQPFFTTKIERKKKIGLGIPLFKQNAEQCEGSFEMTSKPGRGTTLKAVFKLNHVDRMPLGNIADTISTSILGHSEVDYEINYSFTDETGTKDFHFDTRMIRKEIGDIPLSYPDIITFINGSLQEGISGIFVENT